MQNMPEALPVRKNRRGADLKDLTGLPFEKWLVIDRAPNRGKTTMWNCVCVCGTRRAVPGGHLRSGASTSCGCVRAASFTFRTHGATVGGKTEPEYTVWRGMKNRCHGTRVYKNYGGRGIGVCERWRTDYLAFKADMGSRPPGLKLDRIDNNRGYDCGKCDDCKARGASPNCRWATRATQNRNKRDNRLLTFAGETRLAIDWAPVVGIPGVEIRKRALHGMPAEEALTKPVRSRYKLTADLVRQIRSEYARGGVTMVEIADRFGMDSGSICNAIRGKTWAHVV